MHLTTSFQGAILVCAVQTLRESQITMRGMPWEKGEFLVSVWKNQQKMRNGPQEEEHSRVGVLAGWTNGDHIDL